MAEGVGAGPHPAEVRAVWYAGPDTFLGEFWTMLHLPYTLMVLGFVIVGASLTPHPSWAILAGTLLAYFLGLGIGAHMLDQVPGMGSRYVRHWPDRALWVGGFLSLGAAVGIALLAVSWFGGLPLLILVGASTLCAIGYPLAKWFGGRLHRDGVFALSWGSLPFLTSFYAQSGTIDLLAIAVAAVFAAVAVLEIRLSRLSRHFRQVARSPIASSAEASSSREQFRRFDLSLKLLSLLTILGALAVLSGRVVLVVW